MDWLEKRVTTDWMTIRENITTPNRLRTMLKIEDGQLSHVAVALRQASMEGPVEVKRKSTSAVFSFLSKLTRQTPGQTELLSVEGDIRHLMYVIAIENHFACGHLKPADEAETHEPGAVKKLSVQEIFADIQSRMTEKPEVGKDPFIRNIYMELQLYKKEHQQFSTMSPTVPDDRAPTFFANFRQRIDSITEGINHNYQQFIAQENKLKSGSDSPPVEIQLTSPDLSKLLLTQTQELSQIRSTLLFALDEGYKFRDPLLKLFAKRDQFFALLDQELKIFDSKDGTGAHGHPLAVKMSRNLAHYFENQFKINSR